MQTLASYSYLTIYLHPGSHPVLELSWLGYAASTEFRAAATHALTLATDHRITGWISDDRLLGAVRPRDLDWGAEVCVSHLIGLGLQRFAQLEPQDALNRRTIDGMYQEIIPDLPFALRRFTDLALARAWATGAAT